jgi:hypothetical protein
MQACKVTSNCVYINMFYKRKLGIIDELLICGEKTKGRRGYMLICSEIVRRRRIRRAVLSM